MSKKENPKRINLFNKYFGKYGVFFTLILILILSIVVFRDYLFFRNLYLFKDIGSDSLNIVFPKFIHLADYLRNEGIPKWSFNQGMGQYIYPFSLSDPFYWIEYILGRDYLAYGFAYVEVVKITLSSICVYFYLKYLGLYRYTLSIGVLLFCFSSFMVLGGGWWVFSTQAFHLSLLLLAFEKLFKQNSWWLFPIPILLIVSYQPFNLYIFTLFLFVYSTVRYIVSRQKGLKGYTVLLLRMSFLGLIGIGLSSVFLFSNIYELLQSPRVGGDSTYFQKLYSTPLFSTVSPIEGMTIIMRFFSSDLLGTGSNFRGFLNYLEAPMFYIGLFSLLLAPQLFYHLKKTQISYYTVIPVLAIIFLVFPFFRYAFWLFTGNYYRTFSFFISFLILLYALKALNYILRKGSISIGILIVTLLFLLGGLFYPYQLSGYIDKDLRVIIVGFLIVYTFLTYGLTIRKFKFLSQISLILVICIELSWFSYITTSHRSVLSVKEYKEKTGYNDYSNDVVAYLKSIDDGFYRIIKDYHSSPAIHSSINDGKIQNYYGTSSYHSFNQRYYIDFLQATNIIKTGIEHQTRWAPGLLGRPLLQSLGSVKYGLTKGDGGRNSLQGYSFVKKIEDVSVYKNDYFLPLGFTYESYILRTDFDKLSNLQKDIVLLSSFVLDDKSLLLNREFERFNIDSIPMDYTNILYRKDVQKRREGQLNILKHGQNIIEGTITIKNKSLLFLSIPYDKGWKAIVNGKEVPLHLANIGFMGIVLDKGHYNIKLEFEAFYFYYGAFVSLFFIVFFVGIIAVKKRKYA